MSEPLGRILLEQPDAFERRILDLWRRERLLERILEARAGAPDFVFYEGPPTANGRPGIHHVLARTLKDAVCRYWTMAGRRVERKAGWDTHGLPVELEVEKDLGISGKPAIEKLGIAAFNARCRESVWTYKQDWERISERIGYLLDYQKPYVTYEKDYVESVWYLLSRFAANGLLYPGRKVLPWCGRCGTGLSSHEVGQGYKDLDDPSVWVTFPLVGAGSELLRGAELVAWTTTPWTLPSNFAACVHPDFEYAVAMLGGRKFVLLEAKLAEVFGKEPCEILGRVRGEQVAGAAYEPLFAWEGGRTVLDGPQRHAVVRDPFVSAEEGTGVVHMAPYGADDFRIGLRDGCGARLCVGEDARLLAEIAGVPAGTFFRDANKDLAKDLRQRGRLLKLSQFRHSYPHCWRCDTPLIYFPAPAWFLKTTAYKDRMVEENRKIRWSPPEIGAGRFGEWLENNVDWALSRDRYWGTPLPVWICERDAEHWVCIESFAQLRDRAGGLPAGFDPHRPGVDEIRFSCGEEGCGGTMRRVPQVVDCWFDSGAMPYAQHHWPFENVARVREQFPADFIAEGVDQTRGWFYTLHAIGTFVGCVDAGRAEALRLPAGGAFRSCLVGGLLLDAKGQKMSKRLGNVVNPDEALACHGADAIRWSLLAAGPAHQSRRFDDGAIEDVRRRVLGTLAACWDFFALYARTEGWTAERAAAAPAPAAREPLDRWILARAAQATCEVRAAFEGATIEPHLAARALERLIVDELSNWYVRRSRRRFWGDAGAASQAAAFATLQEALDAIARLAAPLAPFLSDALWRRLHPSAGSVHLALLPEASVTPEGEGLGNALDPVLRAAKLGRARREKARLNVRQPLARMTVLLPSLTSFRVSPESPSPLDFARELMEELNVKEVAWEEQPDAAGVQVAIKPNFPTLGPKAGAKMKAVAAAIGALSYAEAQAIQWGGEQRAIEGVILAPEDVVIQYLPAPGQEAETDGFVTIVLDTALTPDLVREGIAREVLNRLQTQRKESGFDVADRVAVRVHAEGEVLEAVRAWAGWIAEEVLAPAGLDFAAETGPDLRAWELPDGRSIRLGVTRLATGARV